MRRRDGYIAWQKIIQQVKMNIQGTKLFFPCRLVGTRATESLSGKRQARQPLDTGHLSMSQCDMILFDGVPWNYLAKMVVDLSSRLTWSSAQVNRRSSVVEPVTPIGRADGEFLVHDFRSFCINVEYFLNLTDAQAFSKRQTARMSAALSLSSKLDQTASNSIPWIFSMIMYSAPTGFS